MSIFDHATAAPRGLLYFASFNAAERAMIAESPELRDAIRGGAPAEWPAIVERHRASLRAAFAERKPQASGSSITDHERQLRYVTAILCRELPRLAGMAQGTGRNDAAFRLVCRVGRWVHHGIIPRDQLITDVLKACERNGLVAEDGRKSVLDTIASGLDRSAEDSLPEFGHVLRKAR
jgi:hypothetical protein